MRAHASTPSTNSSACSAQLLAPRRLPKLPGAVAVARYLPTTAGLEVAGGLVDVIRCRQPPPPSPSATSRATTRAPDPMGQMRTALRASPSRDTPRNSGRLHANRLLMDLGDGPLPTCCYVRRRPGGGLRPVRPPGTCRGTTATRTETEVAEAEGGPPLGVGDAGDFPMSRSGPSRHRHRPDHRRPRGVQGGRHRRGHRPPRARTRRLRPAHLGLVADALLGNARRQRRRRPVLMRYAAWRPARPGELDGVARPRGGPARRRSQAHPARLGVTEETDAILPSSPNSPTPWCTPTAPSARPHPRSTTGPRSPSPDSRRAARSNRRAWLGGHRRPRDLLSRPCAAVGHRAVAGASRSGPEIALDGKKSEDGHTGAGRSAGGSRHGSVRPL